MAFLTSIIYKSGFVETVEGSGVQTAQTAQEIHIAAYDGQVTLCREGEDVLVLFDDGEVVRLVDFPQDTAAMPHLYLLNPDGGSPARYLMVPEDEAACLAPAPVTGSRVLLPAALAAAGAAGVLVVHHLGRNHPPSITDGEYGSDVTEGTGEEPAILTAEGQISFSDKNKKDTHEAITELISAEDSLRGPVAEHGTFTVAVDQQLGSRMGGLDWRFEVDNADVDHLSAWQTVTQTYRVTLVDRKGRTDTTTVTVTITGTNDAPVITGGETEGQVTEIADGADGEGATAHTLTGSLGFADVDLADVHHVTAEFLSAQDSINGAVAERGAFLPVIGLVSTGTGAGRVDWRFDMEDAELEGLAEGQTITQVYAVTLDDGKGGTATQEVAVTFTGSNDGPVAEALAVEADEDGPPVTAAFAFTDVDAADTHTITFDTSGILGTVTDNGDGTFTYDPGGQFKQLHVGNTAVETFTYTVRDSAGAESTETVTVTVIGDNEPPEVPDVALEASQPTNTGFEETPDFSGWTVEHLQSGYTGSAETSIDRSGTLISGDSAVAVLTLQGSVPDVGGTGWGPTITSMPFLGQAGDHVELEYVLDGGDDTGRARGYLLDANTGEIVQQLFDVSQDANTSLLRTVEATLEHTGEFVFMFQVGSRDDTRGSAIQATLKVGYALIETDVAANDRTYDFDKSEFLAGAFDFNGDALDVVSVPPTSSLGASISISGDGTIHYDPTAALADLAYGEVVVDSFEFTVSDGHGGAVTAMASISVMGVLETGSMTAGIGFEGDLDLSLLVDNVDEDRAIFADGNSTPALDPLMAETTAPDTAPTAIPSDEINTVIA